MNDSAFLLDSNVWIALTFNAHPGHDVASDAFAQATNKRPALFCRATQQSFLRLATTPTLMRQYGVAGMTNDDALETRHRFMASPVVAYREEVTGVAPLWHRLAGRKTALPKVWMDAYLAAFAIAGDLRMVTLDTDFKSFEAAGLKLLLLESP